MCGITALSVHPGKSSIPDKRHFMYLAALAIEDRGRDATGFAWSTETDASWYYKDGERASKFIRRRPISGDPHLTVAIGHTRATTQGSAKFNANNHPVIDNGTAGIMLVHNGIIDNDQKIYELLGDEYGPVKAEVDTAAVAAMLANPELLFAGHPIDLLKLVEGSAAFAWIDTNERHVLHLARCEMRPLTIGWTRRGDLVMSSTPESLDALAVMSNTRLRNIREIAEGVYLRVEGGEITDERTFEVAKSKKYSYQKTGTTFGTKIPPGKTTTTVVPANDNRPVLPGRDANHFVSQRTGTTFVQGSDGIYRELSSYREPEPTLTVVSDIWDPDDDDLDAFDSTTWKHDLEEYRRWLLEHQAGMWDDTVPMHRTVSRPELTAGG